MTAGEPKTWLVATHADRGEEVEHAEGRHSTLADLLRASTC